MFSEYISECNKLIKIPIIRLTMHFYEQRIIISVLISVTWWNLAIGYAAKTLKILRFCIGLAKEFCLYNTIKMLCCVLILMR